MTSLSCLSFHKAFSWGLIPSLAWRRQSFFVEFKINKGKGNKKSIKDKKDTTASDEPTEEDIGAETIGAIKEYHGHNRYDINKWVNAIINVS